MTSVRTIVALVVLVQLAAVVALLLQRRRQRSLQDELVAAVSGHPYWRIAFARPAHLNRLWKLNAVQSLGVLIDEGNTIRLRGHWPGSRDALDVSLPKDAAHQPIWHGAPTIRAGNLAWAMFSTPHGELMVAADTGLQALNSRQALTDILRSVFPHLAVPVEALQDFALEKNRWSFVAMLLMLGLALYAALDTYVWSKYELIDAQLYSLVMDPLFSAVTGLLLLAVAAGAYAALRAGKVPSRESWALAALCAVVAALAAPPILKRVDLAWAPSSTIDIPYRVVDRVVNLQPVDQHLGLPALRFKRAPEYWAQFAVGSEVQIPLVRGGLGLWQLDHDRFDPPVLQFYERTQLR